MIKVGVVGEDPNDTSSVISLLSKRFTHVRFKKLGGQARGCQLDSNKLIKALRSDLEAETFKSILYIRDLDGFGSEEVKVKKAKSWFSELNDQFGNNGTLLLNIWELEALILADISTFNSDYKTNYNFKGDPAMQSNPKEILVRITKGMRKQFTVSHCPRVFNLLNIDVVEKNCGYFRQFLKDFGRSISEN